MPKEIEEKLIEIILETSAFNRNSTRFLNTIDQILELFDQRDEEILEEIEKRIPNVESINPSYFRDVIRKFKEKQNL